MEQLQFNSLNDGIPDVWKLHYGLSLNDTTVAGADYNSFGLTNADKYRYNIHPFAPAQQPPPPKTDKAATSKTALPASKSAPAPAAASPSIGSSNFLGYTGPLTRKRTQQQGGYPLGFFYGWVPDIGGWTAYEGRGIEVWRPYNLKKIGRYTYPLPDGEQFVELNARTNNYGIKQKIADARPGTYILKWRDMARQKVDVQKSRYKVHVYAKSDKADEGTAEGKLAQSKQLIEPLDYEGPANWQDELLVFTIPEDLFKTHKNIWIAFIPVDTKSTYGALVDKIVLAPVDIEVVFGFSPQPDAKATLDNNLRQSASCVGSKGGPNDPVCTFVMKGKPAGGKAKQTEKIWVVQTSNRADELKSGLSNAPYVVYNGHSNMGLGPAFNPATIKTTSDFLNIGNAQTAINLPFLHQEGFPQAFTVPDTEVPLTVKNYKVLPQKIQNMLRYDNSNNIGDGEIFTLPAVGAGARASSHHFDRAGNNHYLIIDIPAAARKSDLPVLGYQTFFYNACSTARDYAEIFQHGTFICTNVATVARNENECEDVSTNTFIEWLIEGETMTDIITEINKEQAELTHGQEKSTYRSLFF